MFFLLILNPRVIKARYLVTTLQMYPRGTCTMHLGFQISCPVHPRVQNEQEACKYLTKYIYLTDVHVEKMRIDVMPTMAKWRLSMEHLADYVNKYH